MGLKLLGPTGSHIGVYRRSRGLGFRVWALGLLVLGSLGFEDFLCSQLSSASARYPPKEPLRIKRTTSRSRSVFALGARIMFWIPWAQSRHTDGLTAAGPECCGFHLPRLGQVRFRLHPQRAKLLSFRVCRVVSSV